MTAALDTMLEEVVTAKAERDEDRAAAVGAAFLVCQRVREALGGESLKGAPLVGYLVRGRLEPGHVALVLSKDAYLRIDEIVVEADVHGFVHRTCLARHEDLMVEDLTRVIDTVEEALRVHLSRCEERGSVFFEVRKLAEKLHTALE